MRALLGSLLLVLAAGLALPARASAPRKSVTVAVFDVAPVGVTPEVAQNLTALIAAELGRYDLLKAVTRRELSGLLDLERQRQLLGCSEEACLTQAAGALGVDKLLSGQLGRLESVYVLTLHLIDARTAKVEARASRTVPVDAGGLVDAAKTAVTDLIGAGASSRNQPARLAVPKLLVARRGERVSLDARASYDPDGDPLQVRWRQLDGPPAVLEEALGPLAGFEALEVGRYHFAVQVSDGRAAPQEEQVEVEVRERRRFQLAPGYRQLLSFNRLVEQDAEGNVFRNRAPYGGGLLVGLKLSSRWSLVADAQATSMHVFPEDGALEERKSLDVTTIQVMLGARYDFPLDGFRFFVSGMVGTARVYFSAHEDGRSVDNVRNEAVAADASVGVDLPLGEWFGLLASCGMQVRRGTDRVYPFSGIGFQVARDGLLWGTSLSASPYVRF